MKRWLGRLWTALRLLIIGLLLAMGIKEEQQDMSSLEARIYAPTRDYAFDFVQWEVEALFSKAQQELFGFHAYIPEAERKQLVLDYMALQNRVFILQGQLEATPTPEILAAYRQARAELEAQQPLVEHIIEGQVSAVLQDEGFDWLGQIVPPVTMRFLDVPDVLVVSPRDRIEQYTTLTLDAMDFTERVALESEVAQAVPEMAVWITPIGGVGLYPSMVMQTDRAVIAFEITAHEWVHHYLLPFPLGLGYLSHPDTRIINETTATLVGDEIGNRVIERFYREELAAGLVYLQPVPDYRLLLAAVTGQPTSRLGMDVERTTIQADLLHLRASTQTRQDYLSSIGQAEAAAITVQVRADQLRQLGYIPPVDPTTRRAEADQAGWIHHTRVTTDYLLSLGMVEAAEHAMDNGRQHSGLRVLNQAWFAFNAGYQSNPVIEQRPDGTAVIATTGGGGDPIGAAIYEIRARAGSLKAFLEMMRGITTREELIAALENLRQGGDLE